MRQLAFHSPTKREPACVPHSGAEEYPMLDILMLVLACGLFAAGIGYAYVCERL
ncbi:MAG: hypothetical protein U1E61_12455 [Bradyrhizobium sp.]